MKILIAGAGIGGLTAALCLAKAGHQVHLFERSTVFAEVGAGLQCGANALRVMDHLGLLARLKPFAVEPKSVEFRDHRSGKTLYSMGLGERYAKRYGAPYFHLYRPDLHAVLLEAFSNTGQVLELNADIVSYQETEKNVVLNLKDGRTFEGDCLIGADGIRSVIRDQLLGQHKPTFTGNVAWRAVVAVERLPNGWMDKVTTNFVGPRKHMVLYYLRDQKLANLVGIVENKSWTDDSWVVKSPWEEMQADFQGWHPMAQSMIDAVDKDECYRWALYNHAPFSNWSSQRVTLLGDAAHATLPFMASGAAMAIEDARILDRALGQASSIQQGLGLYQSNRIARTTRIQRTSERMGRLYHIDNALVRNTAFKALSVMAGRAEAFLPNYDANSVPLR